jgi:hypothetical protein
MRTLATAPSPAPSTVASASPLLVFKTRAQESPPEEPQQILEIEDFICMTGVSYTRVSENSRTPSRADGQETNNDACLFLQPFVLAWLHSTVRKTHLA